MLSSLSSRSADFIRWGAVYHYSKAWLRDLDSFSEFFEPLFVFACHLFSLLVSKANKVTCSRCPNTCHLYVLGCGIFLQCFCSEGRDFRCLHISCKAIIVSFLLGWEEGTLMVLVTHIIYFAPVFIDCRGPCDPSEPSEERLCKCIDQVGSG
jgi:hypothetical protein